LEDRNIADLIGTNKLNDLFPTLHDCHVNGPLPAANRLSFSVWAKPKTQQIARFAGSIFGSDHGVALGKA
jgi:hypothetical protein